MKIVKVNCFLAVLSVLSGCANLFVGLGSEGYDSFDAFLAFAQIFIALAVLVTGFSKLNLCFKNSLLSKAHVYFAFLFYGFIVGVVVLVPI